jgi:CDP-paratose 2-epimerase
MNLITGSKGFLGKHLLKKLSSVITIPHEQIQTTKPQPFDNFFFLSSYGNMSFQTESDKIIKANVLDLSGIIEKASHIPFKSFVFISTSSVKLRIQTMYSRSKKAAEEILLSYMEKYNLPICIIRPTTIYGLNEQPQHLIPTILRSCFKGEKMDFVKDAVHDYIFVEDVVEGILNLSEHSARGIYENGTGVQTSNQQILELIENITNKKANINIVPSMRVYDNLNWVSTNFRARSWGWLPKITLRQGLERVVEDYIKNPKSYDK